MCGLYFDLSSPLHFPPLSKPITNIKKPERCYIDDLNDTLLELILKLLSWKHLSTFKCVYKRWNEVISNPDFVRQYFPFTLFLQAKNETCLVTEHPYFQTHNFCLNFLPSNASDYMVAYHNELLLIHREEKVYYIANPLTKQFVVIPLPLIESDHRTKWWCRMVGLAGVVEGVSSECINNLGFRIVLIVDNNNQEAILQIYSSQMGQWITQPLENVYIGYRHKGVTLKNKVYWLGLLNILVIDPFSDDIIVPRLINLPLGIRENSILGICRTRLRIATLETKYGGEVYPRIKVWEFEDCGDDLTKFRLVINFSLDRYFIDSVISFDYTFNSFDRNQMICCHPNDPDIVYFIYGQKLFCCDVVKPGLKAMSGKLESYGFWGNSIIMTHPLTMR